MGSNQSLIKDVEKRMLNTTTEVQGPHPSYIQIAKPYVFDHKVQECLLAAGVTEAREDSIRLQGVAWIDSTRKALHL